MRPLHRFSFSRNRFRINSKKPPYLMCPLEFYVQLSGIGSNREIL